MENEYERIYRKILNNSLDESLIDEIENMHTKEYCVVGTEYLENPRIDLLRRKYSQLLYERELISSLKFQTEVDAKEFYKWDIYLSRCRFEIHCAEMILDKKIKKILFVGAGSMPISAIVADSMGYVVSAIDIDEKASGLGIRISKEMGSTLSYENIDLFNYGKYKDFDLIIVSGSVGCSESEKGTILEALFEKMSNKSSLCFRVPVREEKFLMASLPDIYSGKRTVFSMETPDDYMSRVFFTK